MMEEEQEISLPRGTLQDDEGLVNAEIDCLTFDMIEGSFWLYVGSPGLGYFFWLMGAHFLESEMASWKRREVTESEGAYAEVGKRRLEEK